MSRALGGLGLAMRAGRVQCGESVCDKLSKAGGARLVLIDAAISPGSFKAVTDACRYYGVPYVMTPAGELGRAIGRTGRMTAVITDEGFAERLKGLLSAEGAEIVNTKQSSIDQN